MSQHGARSISYSSMLSQPKAKLLQLGNRRLYSNHKMYESNSQIENSTATQKAELQSRFASRKMSGDGVSFSRATRKPFTFGQYDPAIDSVPFTIDTQMLSQFKPLKPIQHGFGGAERKLSPLKSIRKFQHQTLGNEPSDLDSVRMKQSIESVRSESREVFVPRVASLGRIAQGVLNSALNNGEKRERFNEG